MNDATKRGTRNAGQGTRKTGKSVVKASAQSKPPLPTEVRSAMVKDGSVKPVEIRFGPFHQRLREAHEIPLVIADWLLKQGKTVQNFENFVHPSNIGFKPTATTKRLSSGQFMEVGDDQKDLLRKARILLDSCGYHGRPLEVLLEDGTILTA